MESTYAVTAFARVFHVQCHTAIIAKQLTGVMTDVCQPGMLSQPPYCLRFKTSASKSFRSAVAKEAWTRRQLRRLSESKAHE